MWSAEVAVLTFLGFAVMLNALVFGGTALAYFLDKHRESRPRLTPTGSPRHDRRADHSPAPGFVGGPSSTRAGVGPARPVPAPAHARS
jgi:hypothetical protein